MVTKENTRSEWRLLRQRGGGSDDCQLNKIIKVYSVEYPGIPKASRHSTSRSVALKWFEAIVAFRSFLR
jgi:hypothetical protein